MQKYMYTMLANQIQHYLKYRHITHSGCTGTCIPHQLCTHAPSAVDAPHISSPSTPCSTSPWSNTRMPHQHHTHSPSAPHTHIHLHTPNNLTVSSLHWDLGSTNITCNYIFVTFDSFLLFFSHIWWFYYHIKQYQHYIWQYFCHIWLYSYFFLAFNDTIFKFCNTKITCNCTFVTFSSSIFFLANDGSIVTLNSTNITFEHNFLTFGCTLIFFLTFDSVVLILCSTNIICNCTFVTFSAPLISLSYWMVPLSH